MPAVDSVEIGAGFVIEIGLLAADPVVLATARVGLVDDLADEGARSLAGDQGGLHLVQGAIGAIDVQEGIHRQTVGQHLAGDPDGHLGGGVEMSVTLEGRQRHGDGRNAHQIGLHGGRHRTGIGDIVTQIGSVIDPRDHQVGPDRQQAVNAHIDAIGGGAVNGKEPVAQLEDPQGRVQRQGVSGGAPLAVGRDDRDRAQLPQRLGQGQDAGGMDAVVVGNHDMHVIDPVATEVESRPVMAEIAPEIKP